MKDKYGREIDYMRISITERCNYRCFYCMPQEGGECNVETKEENLLSRKEIVSLVETGARLGIKKVRITGGEPLIRRDIEEILQGISKVHGIEELCLTTNGSLLDKKMEVMKECGVTRINVSLDTLIPERFREITKTGDYLSVWKGIERAIESGIQVRINSVVVQGINDDEVLNLAALTEKYPIDVRFIELMPIGEGKKYKGFSGSEIREKISHMKKIENLEKREGASDYYRLEGAKGKIGFINPLSNCFCQECNRIRVTSEGEVKQCLNKKSSINIGEVMRSDRDGTELAEVISKEIYNKPEKHLFNSLNEFEEKYNMNQIGG